MTVLTVPGGVLNGEQVGDVVAGGRDTGAVARGQRGAGGVGGDGVGRRVLDEGEEE